MTPIQRAPIDFLFISSARYLSSTLWSSTIANPEFFPSCTSSVMSADVRFNPSKNSTTSYLVTEKGRPRNFTHLLIFSSVTRFPHITLEDPSFVRSNRSYSDISISFSSIHLLPRFYLCRSERALSESSFVWKTMHAWPDFRPYSSYLYLMLVGIIL